MWTRSELKAKAKVAFKANFWKSVFIAAILAFFVNAASMGSGAAGSSAGAGAASSSNGAAVSVTTTSADGVTTTYEGLEAVAGSDFAPLLAIIPLVLILAVALIALVIAFDIFIINPTEIGCRRFFVHNLNQKSQVKEVAYVFDHEGYKNAAKVMFWRDIKTIGWLLLFIIPGVIKAYEYRMIPYLLAENPSMSKEEAFAETKRLMKGNKMRAFILDLSFLGWNILGLFTLGVLNVLYVAPYQAQTDAALYEALRYGNGDHFAEQLPQA